MKKLLSIMIIILVLTGCRDNQDEITEYLTTIDKMQDDYNEKIQENLSLIEENKKLESQMQEKNLEVEELSNTITRIENEEIKIPDTSNWKRQELSGLRKYIGDIGIRAFPSEDSPIVVEATQLTEDNAILFCRAVVTVASSETSGHDGTSWGIVLMNDYGQTKVGYVPYKELEVIESQEIKFVESIGTFHLGDRIEKMIGVLDQDFEIKSENTCMYFFYDDSNQEVELHYRVGPTIEAFVSQDFRIWYLRTDSPKYVLNSGFKVGDNAIEVLQYYRKNYNEEESDFYYPTGRFQFRLSETEFIGFYIDTEELTNESVITWIGLF